jgi:hypothetical protein
MSFYIVMLILFMLKIVIVLNVVMQSVVEPSKGAKRGLLDWSRELLNCVNPNRMK